MAMTKLKLKGNDKEKKKGQTLCTKADWLAPSLVSRFARICMTKNLPTTKRLLSIISKISSIISDPLKATKKKQYNNCCVTYNSRNYFRKGV